MYMFDLPSYSDFQTGITILNKTVDNVLKTKHLQEVIFAIVKRILCLAVAAPIYKYNHNLFILGFIIGFIESDKFDDIINRIKKIWNVHIVEKVAIAALFVLSIKVIIPISCLITSAYLGKIVYQYADNLNQVNIPRIDEEPGQ